MMMATMSFAADIRPLFTDIDIDHMKPQIDLGSKDDVTANAAKILVVVTSGAMPPPGEHRRWTPEMCDTFKLWIDQGCPP
jgi:hypothetical protein